MSRLSEWYPGGLTLFGGALRETRKANGVAALAIATEIGVSRGYLHDVEHGRRAPLSSEHVERVAAFLGIDAAPLLESAALDRGYVRIAVSSAEQARAALAFAAGLTPAPASSDGW